MDSRKWNFAIGLFFAAASAITLIWWIPADVETGIIVQERRSTDIGDAMAPTMISIGILIVSVILIASALFRAPATEDNKAEYDTGITLENFQGLLWILLIIAVSLSLMVWAGPAVVRVLQSLGADVPEYRLLRDTVPYKYIGLAAGGFVLVCGLISWIEGRIAPRAILTAVAAVVALIVLYDVPFDSLLLPPNGDG